MQRTIVESLTHTHRMMERVLILIRLQIALLQPGDDDKGFLLLSNALGYLHDYPGVVHHPAEEILFDHLLRYAPDSRVLCQNLREQHREFARQEASLLQHIERARSGDLGSCWRIEEIGIAYCAEHADHILKEETEAFPQAVDHVPPDAWRAIGKQTLQAVDPLGDREPFGNLEDLYDYFAAAAEGRSGMVS